MSARFGQPNGDGGRESRGREMLGAMADPNKVKSGANPSGKSSMDRLNDAATTITQNAAERNYKADIEAEAMEQIAFEEAVAAANERHIEVEKEYKEEIDEEFDDDPEVQSLQERRLAAMKARYNADKQNMAQGHGEYREIVEEDFLKEVCGSLNVVVHFSHPEFFRCRVIDKHMRLLAHKHRGCKFLHLNAEKAPFFIEKLAIQVLPALICFKDGVKGDQLFGFEELGGKDEFRTEVLEYWLARANCIKLKKESLRKCEQAIHGENSSDEDSDSGDDN